MSNVTKLRSPYREFQDRMIRVEEAVLMWRRTVVMAMTDEPVDEETMNVLHAEMMHVGEVLDALHSIDDPEKDYSAAFKKFGSNIQ